MEKKREENRCLYDGSKMGKKYNRICSNDSQNYVCLFWIHCLTYKNNDDDEKLYKLYEMP